MLGLCFCSPVEHWVPQTPAALPGAVDSALARVSWLASLGFLTTYCFPGLQCLACWGGQQSPSEGVALQAQETIPPDDFAFFPFFLPSFFFLLKSFPHYATVLRYRWTTGYTCVQGYRTPMAPWECLHGALCAWEKFFPKLCVLLCLVYGKGRFLVFEDWWLCSLPVLQEAQAGSSFLPFQ